MSEEVTLRHIADIVHAGGLANIGIEEAVVLVRRLTLPYWDLARTRDEMRRDIEGYLKTLRRSPN